MRRGQTHLICIIHVVPIGGCSRYFLSSNDILGLACLQATCLLDKLRDIPERESNVRLHAGSGIDTGGVMNMFNSSCLGQS